MALPLSHIPGIHPGFPPGQEFLESRSRALHGSHSKETPWERERGSRDSQGMTAGKGSSRVQFQVFNSKPLPKSFGKGEIFLGKAALKLSREWWQERAPLERLQPHNSMDFCEHPNVQFKSFGKNPLEKLGYSLGKVRMMSLKPHNSMDSCTNPGV